MSVFRWQHQELSKAADINETVENTVVDGALEALAKVRYVLWIKLARSPEED
jgi:hypothetical protein